MSPAPFRGDQAVDPREEYLALLAEKQRRERFKGFEIYKPYKKQIVIKKPVGFAGHPDVPTQKIKKGR